MVPIPNRLLLLSIWISLVWTITAAPIGDVATVQSPQGPIRGKANVHGIYNFLGIRYATANRWEPPNPISATSTPIEAVEFGVSCPQICQNVLCPEKIGEDCLFLNIYTPFDDAVNLQTTATPLAPRSLLPVIVFIHGGSFETGGAGMVSYDASELAVALNAVVVTFNYRLSVFGFFDVAGIDFPAVGSPINFGIMDQRLAIQWTIANIPSFGGDPAKITYLGQSAGAQSILFHLAHPSTHALIKRMILMSPPALALTSTDQAREMAGDVATRLECTTSGCVKSKTMREMLNAWKDKGDGEDTEQMSKIVGRTMMPVVDGVDVLGNPFELLGIGNVVEGVKAMIGGVSNETSLFIDQANPGDISTPMFNILVEALFSPHDQQAHKVYATNKEGYLADRKPVLTRMASDWVFLCPQRQSVRKGAIGGPRVWSYVLEAPWLGGADESLGNVCKGLACHTTDLSFLFRMGDDAKFKEVTTAFRAYVKAFIQDEELTPISLPAWTSSTNDIASYPILRFPNPEPLTLPYAPVLEPTHPLTPQCDFWDMAGYEYAPLTSIADTTYLKATAPAFKLRLLIVALSAIVAFVVIEFLLLLRGLYHRRYLLGLFRLVIKDEAELQNAIKDLNNQQQILSSRHGSAEEVGFVKSIKQVVEQRKESIYVEEQPVPVVVETRGLTYRANDREGGKRLLDCVETKFLPGTVTAIMGSSGAGKTTMLNLLNRRLKASSTEDKIYFAGKPLSDYSAARFRGMTGFVAQHDAPYYGLTVREVMMFNAELELPKTMSHLEKVRRINRQLKLLNIMQCADVVIQRPEQNQGGIRGGQMRRLSIAVALLRKPSVLFLDEPTSGLDAKSTLDVGLALSQLASQGYTIICSIHQPRPEMFALFHQIVVLVYGRLLFSGTPSESLTHFTKLRIKLAKRTAEMNKGVGDEGSRVFEIDEEEEEEEEGGVANPADLVLDVAGAIKLSDAAWAVGQLGGDDLKTVVESKQPQGQVSESQPDVSRSHSLSQSIGNFPPPTHHNSQEWGTPRSSIAEVPIPLTKSMDVLNKVLDIAKKYTVVENGRVLVAKNERRASAPAFDSPPQEPLIQRDEENEESPPPFASLRHPDSFDRLESGKHHHLDHSPPEATAPKRTLTPTLSTNAITRASDTAGSANLLKKPGGNRPWALEQMFIVTSRWWATRPVRRKMNMMIISAAGVWILALLQRRPGMDALSLVLQTKGLALACIGLPALKNIHISFDYYEDRDIYNFDSVNGTLSPLAFFLHRLVYETSNATIEGFIAVISAYFILGCNPDPLRIGTAMVIFVVYYNCTTTLFTWVYSTRLGRPEARSVAFFSQAVLAIVSGVWIKKGDATVYNWIAWAQYLNPTYWALSPLVRANAAHAGECILSQDGYCRATLGDVIVEQARADRITPGNGLLALVVIWLVMRGLQLLLLLRDAYWDTFWTAKWRRWGPEAWVAAGKKAKVADMREMQTQTGPSLEDLQGLEGDWEEGEEMKEVGE